MLIFGLFIALMAIIAASHALSAPKLNGLGDEIALDEKGYDK